MDVKPAWIGGLRPVRGSLRLIAMRWALSLVAALPGVAVASAHLGDAAARRPYYAEAPDPLPLFRFLRLLRDVPGSVWGLLAAGALFAWLGNLVLTAGAVEILDPARSGKVRVLRTVCDAGAASMWAYLRIALLAALSIAIGFRLIGTAFDWLGDHGREAGWTGRTLVQTLLVLQAVALILWANLVGVFAWWCRVIVAADHRRYVRRLPPMVLCLCRRRPFRAAAAHFLVALATLGVGATVLVAWRQSSSAPAGWIVLWLAVVLLQACIWHWRLRASRLIWLAPDLGQLRARPDSSGRLLEELRRRMRRRQPGVVRSPVQVEGPP